MRLIRYDCQDARANKLRLELNIKIVTHCLASLQVGQEQCSAMLLPYTNLAPPLWPIHHSTNISNFDTTLDRFSQISHNFIRFNIHILLDRNRTTLTHSHIVTGFRQAYWSILNDFRCIDLGNLDQIRHTASPQTGTGETIGVIVRYQ